MDILTINLKKYNEQNPYIGDGIKQIFFLTGNQNKINEIVEYCLTLQSLHNLIGFISIDLEEIQCESEDLEKGSTEITINKIIKAIDKIHCMIEDGILNFGTDKIIFIVEDTSLYLNETQNNFPGPFIKFMKPIDIINLVNGIEIINPGQNARSSRVVTQFAYAEYNRKKATMSDITVVSGETNGQISKTLKGIDGWGFDFCFIPNFQECGLEQFNDNKELLKKIKDKTYSELLTFLPNVNLKKYISHRTKAIQNLFIRLEKIFI